MRRLTIISTLALALSLSACGGNNPGSPGASGTPGPDATNVGGSTSPLETGATAGAGGSNNGSNTTGSNPGGQGTTAGPNGSDAQAGGPNAEAGDMSATTSPSDGNTGATSSCDALVAPLGQALGTDMEVSESALSDPISGGSMPGCQLIASGTGEQFESHTTVAQQVGTLLASRGWAVDNQYAADGPTSTVQGYRSGDMLALVTSGWQPAPDISCPADQPISSCDVPPAKRMFSIVVNIAPASAGAQATPGA